MGASLKTEKAITSFRDTDRNLAQLNFFLSLDRVAIERSDYTLLNFLGDISATFGALSSIVGIFLVNVLRIQTMFDSYLINKVFRYKKPGNNQLKTLKLSYSSWLCNKICKVIGPFSKFCNQSNFSKLDHKMRKIGTRRIDRELDIARFIR
jgi:hypothetical protein